MASMIQIRVAHRRVLTLDVHAANLMGVVIRCYDLMHDLNHRIARLVIELSVPEFLKPAMRFDIVDALVVGEHHRNQSSIAGALHVVLTAQWMQARAWLTNLTGNAHERN